MDTAAAMKALSAPHERGEKLPDIIARCVRLTGFSYSRCFEMYYGRAKRIEPEEIACIELALRRKERRDARNELSELRLRIEMLEARYRVGDADFHSPDIDGLGQILRPVR